MQGARDDCALQLACGLHEGQGLPALSLAGHWNLDCAIVDNMLTSATAVKVAALDEQGATAVHHAWALPSMGEGEAHQLCRCPADGKCEGAVVEVECRKAVHDNGMC